MIEPHIRKSLSLLGVEAWETTPQGWVHAPCPFAPYYHSSGMDRHPSFFVKVNPEGASGFFCHTCKAKGRLSKLPASLHALGELSLEESRRLTFEVEDLEADENYEWRETDAEEMDDPLNRDLFLGMFPLVWDEPLARRYLKRRKIAREVCDWLSLRYDPEEQRILFPVIDHAGDLYGFTGRTVLDRSEFPYENFPKVRDFHGLHKSRHILGEQIWRGDKPILIVEGLFGLASALSSGAWDFWDVGATMGSNMSETQADILRDAGQPVWLLYDDDLPGDIGLYGILNRAIGKHEGGGAIDKLKGHVPVIIPSYPDGFADVDDFGPEEWAWMWEYRNHQIG